ncbi:MAG: hypothetical protein KF778_03795 [Rhodocyclaceae bacterium]|nr:hypothetical protein [Rhodocyclaceae bacterium]MBX3667502.1 hypothetical protein [Rhodocyclaceae bacterium]
MTPVTNTLTAVCIAAALAVSATPAGAADTADAAKLKALEQKLEQSLRMIEALQDKVKSLEGSAAAKSAPANTAAAAEQSARLDSLERQVSQLGSGLASRSSSDDGLPVHGFADVGMRRSGENNAVFGKGNKGAAVGLFDLYLSPQFGDHVKALVELAVEVDRDGGAAIDLERLQAGYAFNDALTAWIGRFHTPYGYWNTAFHHGAQIQTSILRPRFLDFEDKGGILPTHTVGGWLTGALNVGPARVGYDAYAGNAPHIEGATPTAPSLLRRGELNMRAAGSGSHQTSTGFNLWVSPRSLSALRIGLHGLRANVADDLANNTRLNMLGGYGVFIDDNWEVLGEYYHFRNRDLSGASGTHGSNASYLQAGYNFGRVTPFARAERTRLDQTDNYFGSQLFGRSYDRFALGMRYDLNAKSALKFELNRTRQKDLVAADGITAAPDDSYIEALMQFSFRF